MEKRCGPRDRVLRETKDGDAEIVLASPKGGGLPEEHPPIEDWTSVLGSERLTGAL